MGKLKIMMMDVYEAYDSRSDHALSEALFEFRRQLISKVQAVGPAAVALQLGDERPRMAQILNKLEARASAEPREFVAFLAGFIRAYVDYFELIVRLDDVDSADAQMFAGRDQHDKVGSVRIMILKATFAHAGTRAKELVRLVARAADVKESSVKFHVKKLVDIGLVKRVELGRKAVSYRIAPLGEAVLSRRSKPHELALLIIDEAAFDATLRAAISQEIKSTWPDEQNQKDGAAITKKIEDRPATPAYFFSYTPKVDVTPEAITLNQHVIRYYRKNRLELTPSL